MVSLTTSVHHDTNPYVVRPGGYRDPRSTPEIGLLDGYLLPKRYPFNCTVKVFIVPILTLPSVVPSPRLLSPTIVLGRFVPTVVSRPL